MNNSTRDEWRTPFDLYQNLRSQYKFNFDCCATSANAKTAHWTDDFLSYWPGRKTHSTRFWMNPPFSKAQTMFDHFFSIAVEGVAIYRCDNMETEIWQVSIIPHCDWIFVIRGRINYEGFSGNSPRFPSALIGVGLDPPQDVEGVTLAVKK